MEKEISINLRAADEKSFRGQAFSSLLAAAEEDVPIKLYYVRFEPGARTNWHSHSGGQILVVTNGRCRYQIGEGAVREIGTGESVRFEPGERHWHGAALDEAAEHIAVNLDSRQTDWLEQVTDEQYGGTTR